MKRSILLSENDTIVTVITKAEKGDTFSITDRSGKICGEVVVKEEIPFAHKVAIVEMRKGDKVVKNGTVIGEAYKDISVGEYVHIHNVISLEGRRAIR